MKQGSGLGPAPLFKALTFLHWFTMHHLTPRGWKIPVFSILRTYPGLASSFPRLGFRLQACSRLSKQSISSFLFFCFLFLSKPRHLLLQISPFVETYQGLQVHGRCHGWHHCGLGPSLSAWQASAEPELISSVIHTVEKYSGCLREPPVKTIHSLIPVQAT